MHALKRGRRLFGSVDQAKTDSVNRKHRGEKQPEQKEGDENLGQGKRQCAAGVLKFHSYHSAIAAPASQAGRLRNLRFENYVSPADGFEQSVSPPGAVGRRQREASQTERRSRPVLDGLAFVTALQAKNAPMGVRAEGRCWYEVS